MGEGDNYDDEVIRIILDYLRFFFTFYFFGFFFLLFNWISKLFHFSQNDIEEWKIFFSLSKLYRLSKYLLFPRSKVYIY